MWCWSNLHMEDLSTEGTSKEMNIASKTIVTIITPDNDASTLTELDKFTKIIPKTYFLNKNQFVDTTLIDADKDWRRLRKFVIS